MCTTSRSLPTDRALRNFALFLNIFLAETAFCYAGSARHELELKVYAHPTIAATVDTVTVFEGQSAVLPCDVSGTPEPTVRWRKGAALVDSDDQRKTIRSDNSLLIFSSQVCSKPELLSKYHIPACLLCSLSQFEPRTLIPQTVYCLYMIMLFLSTQFY